MLLQGELHRWFENCEMRSIMLADPSGGGGLDPWWFQGGQQLQRAGELQAESTVGNLWCAPSKELHKEPLACKYSEVYHACPTATVLCPAPRHDATM